MTACEKITFGAIRKINFATDAANDLRVVLFKQRKCLHIFDVKRGQHVR